MSERWIVNCEGSERQPRCAYTRVARGGALHARMMAEAHCARQKHNVAVYRTQTERAGYCYAKSGKYEPDSFLENAQKTVDVQMFKEPQRPGAA